MEKHLYACTYEFFLLLPLLLDVIELSSISTIRARVNVCFIFGRLPTEMHIIELIQFALCTKSSDSRVETIGE